MRRRRTNDDGRRREPRPRLLRTVGRLISEGERRRKGCPVGAANASRSVRGSSRSGGISKRTGQGQFTIEKKTTGARERGRTDRGHRLRQPETNARMGSKPTSHLRSASGARAERARRSPPRMGFRLVMVRSARSPSRTAGADRVGCRRPPSTRGGNGGGASPTAAQRLGFAKCPF